MCAGDEQCFLYSRRDTLLLGQELFCPCSAFYASCTIAHNLDASLYLCPFVLEPSGYRLSSVMSSFETLCFGIFSGAGCSRNQLFPILTNDIQN